MLEHVQFSSGIIPGLEKYFFRKHSLNKHLYLFEDDGSQLITLSELWHDKAAVCCGCVSSNSLVYYSQERVVSSSGQTAFRSVVMFRNVGCSFYSHVEREETIIG